MTTTSTLIPLFNEDYEEFIKFYQHPINATKKGIRVRSEGVRYSTKGKKTKIRTFDIKFKPVGFKVMTIY